MKRTPEKIETLRVMAADKALTPEIAEVLGVSPACVWYWAKQEGIRLQSPSEAMRKVTSNPAWRAKISAAMKRLHADPVYRGEHMMRMAKVRADPAFLEKQMSGLARYNRNRRKKAAPTVEVPPWVPDDLAEEYREHVVLNDEYAAAKHVRALKAEMRATA